jgi:ketosteroid isomerase-like protein
MSVGSRAEIVRSVFAAYMSKDRELVENALAEDFTFTSPYDDAIDRATYFERCWPNSEMMHSATVEMTFEQGEDVAVLYRVVTKEGKEFCNMELHRFDGDRIAQVEVFFGATYKNGAFVKQQ